MKLSLIIPVFNEADNLRELFSRIVNTLTPLEHEWEMIFINDGSTDASQDILQEFVSQSQYKVQVIDFRRNFGQTAAIAAGIEYAKGEVVILLDADLQNDPADIPLLLEKLEEGYDVVSGWRKHRRDNFLLRTMPSRVANALISLVTGLKLHDYGCTLKAYRREFLRMFRLYGEMHRFIPVYAEASGARVTEVVVQHHPRTRGRSKYGLDRTIKVILDLFTVKFLMAYSAKPMRLFGGVGLGLMVLSIGLLIFLAVRRIVVSTSVLSSPFFIISILMFILGFISISLGMIAELLIRTYYETQGKSTFAIRAVSQSDLKK
jgi:glycosyltransferase involved in cell wall biosynthesis